MLIHLANTPEQHQCSGREGEGRAGPLSRLCLPAPRGITGSRAGLSTIRRTGWAVGACTVPGVGTLSGCRDGCRLELVAVQRDGVAAAARGAASSAFLTELGQLSGRQGRLRSPAGDAAPGTPVLLAAASGRDSASRAGSGSSSAAPPAPGRPGRSGLRRRLPDGRWCWADGVVTRTMEPGPLSAQAKRGILRRRALESGKAPQAEPRPRQGREAALGGKHTLGRCQWPSKLPSR